jgi:hypothetical protein
MAVVEDLENEFGAKEIGSPITNNSAHQVFAGVVDFGSYDGAN